jgi:hypothetical protein
VKALFEALMKGKGAAESKDEAAPESGSSGADYKQIAKDAAKDGDWDAMIDALCAYHK